MNELSLKDIDLAQRLHIATSVAGMGLTEYGILMLFKILRALDEKGGGLTVGEITDIKTQSEIEFKEHQEKYKSL